MHSVKQFLTGLSDNGWNRARRLSRVAGIGYAIFLALWIAIARLFGERWWPTSVLIYLPPQVWLLPLGILIPAAFILERRLLAILFACLLMVVFCFAGFRLGLGSRSASAGSSVLTVLTNNVGENHRQSMAAFVKETNPDVMVFEDAARHAVAYRRAYPGWTVAAAGEYVLVSRFPVSHVELVHPPELWRNPPAAAFRVDWPGRPFTLYAVHLPTPRMDFVRLRGRGFVVELVRGTLWQRIAIYRQAMQKRVELARWLAREMGQQHEAVLAAGDFNMPSWGAVDAIFDAHLTDAFEASGWGFGFTFPGDLHNPLTLFEPWLRLDRAFCNRAWIPLTCRVEPHRRSQHRCVAARFEWIGNR